MDISKIDDKFSVSPQIGPQDIEEIAAQGFRAIICNRPDSEGDDQPDRSALENAAKSQDIDFTYIPVVPGNFTPEAVDAMASALDASDGPVLGFCKTGMRATKLYELVNAQYDQTSDASSSKSDIMGSIRSHFGRS